jgi:hypothetical protein
MAKASRNIRSGGATRGDYKDLWKDVKRLFDINVTDEYIVFVDKESDLDWETTEEYDAEHTERPPFDLAKCNEILNQAALLEATPCDGFSPPVKNQFKRLIGEGVACNLEHDYIGAQSALVSATQYLRARSEETSRFWYLSACFGMTIPLLVLGLALWVGRETAAEVLRPMGLWLILAAIAGGSGALLSVILRSGKLHFDSCAGKYLHYLEGGSRIWAGMLSGGLVVLAMKSDIILPVLANAPHGNAVTLMAGFAAGASERLAGSIISKFESSEANAGSSATGKERA